MDQRILQKIINLPGKLCKCKMRLIRSLIKLFWNYWIRPLKMGFQCFIINTGTVCEFSYFISTGKWKGKKSRKTKLIPPISPRVLCRDLFANVPGKYNKTTLLFCLDIIESFLFFITFLLFCYSFSLPLRESGVISHFDMFVKA